MKNRILTFLFIFLGITSSFSQVDVGKISVFQYNTTTLKNEILRLVSSASTENTKTFNYCTLKYMILYNADGSAGLPNCEINNEIYIAIKDDEKFKKDKLYILKNIYSFDVNSLKFEEVDDGIIMYFNSTIAKKSRNYKIDLDYVYTNVQNKYKITFEAIKKL